MSSLIVSHDSNLMMLEISVDKLSVPNTSPFDAVILSKSIVSFNFLDDDWIDITPKRLDYRNYRGSNGEEQLFHGGKSVVFSLASYCLEEESDGLDLEIHVRREISQYFECADHCADVGNTAINIDELFNGIVEELRIRRQLEDYLDIAHERDSICRSMKGTYQLREVESGCVTSSFIKVYVRLSHLGNSIITEIDRPGRIPERFPHFYAQEQTNLNEPYECLEIPPETRPDSKPPVAVQLKNAQVECDCSPEQKHELLLDWCTRTCGTSTKEDLDCKDGKGGKGGKRSKGRKGGKVKSTGTDAAQRSIGIGTGKDGSGKKKTGNMSLADYLAQLNALKMKKKGGSGGGAGVFIEKYQSCQPCEPCEPSFMCVPCEPSAPCALNYPPTVFCCE